MYFFSSVDGCDFLSMDILLFPPTCTNLIVGTSNCGKTYLVQHIVKNFDLFFPHCHIRKPTTPPSTLGVNKPLEQDDAHDYNGSENEDTDTDVTASGSEEDLDSCSTRIYVVHCNDKTPRWSNEFSLHLFRRHRLKLSQFDIEEFNLDLVAPHSLVIFDDVSVLHASITTAVNVGSHHIPLLAVFVISQNIVGTVHYALTKLCHRVIFCCNTVNALDAANNILRKQVSDVQMRQTLQTILAFCHKQKTKFLLELNNLATWPTNYYGYSHLGEMKPPFPYCLAYSMKEAEWKKKMSVAAEPWSAMESEQEKTAFKDLVKNAKHLPENTMIVLPVSSLDLKQTILQQEEQDASVGGAGGKCYAEAIWEEVRAIVIEDIKLAFPTSKWRAAIALAEGILRTKALCVSRDGKFLWIKNQVHMFHGGGEGGGNANRGHNAKKNRRRRKRKKRKVQQKQQRSLPMISVVSGSNRSTSDVNLLNFIRDVQRPAMTLTEKLTTEWRQYRAIVRVLKERGVPNFLFKNKVICK